MCPLSSWIIFACCLFSRGCLLCLQCFRAQNKAGVASRLLVRSFLGTRGNLGGKPLTGPSKWAVRPNRSPFHPEKSHTHTCTHRLATQTLKWGSAFWALEGHCQKETNSWSPPVATQQVLILSSPKRQPCEHLPLFVGCVADGRFDQRRPNCCLATLPLFCVELCPFSKMSTSHTQPPAVYQTSHPW